MKTDFLRLPLVAAAASLAACTTYVGHKLGPDGALPAAATGIPYTMTKPEYTVDVAADSEDSSKEVYTLRKTDVPDPSQRYTIALDPALFTDGKFTVKLGDNGNLTEANSVVTSRAVATIKAVGTIALNSAKGAYDQTGPAKAALDRYREFLKKSPHPACTAKIGTSPGETASQSIDKAIMTLVDKGEKKKPGSGVEAAASEFFYTSLNEKDCLTAVRNAIDGATVDYVKASLKSYDEATLKVSQLDGTTPAETVAAVGTIVGAVKGWVEAKDVASIAKAITYTGKHYRDLQVVDRFMTAARDYVNRMLADDRVKALAQAFELKPNVWRARVVRSIGREIETLRLQKDLTPNDTEIADQIAERERRRADLVGGLTLFDRIRNIEEFLKEVRAVKFSSNGYARYAAEEHIKMREERDKLDKQLQDLIASTLSSDTKGGETAKIKSRVNQSVRLADKNFVDEVNAGVGVLFDGLPEFVLVLARKEGGNFSDAPVLKSTKEVRK